MPKVGKKSYPYTAAGMQKAKEASKKKGKPMRKQGKSRR
tara:strand:- start:1187 stop:1303 length:117 start_codon:yes stop_codon:yes gene_type:complete